MSSHPRVPCPYCGTRFGIRDNLRLHIAANVCGKVPEGMGVVMDLAEQHSMPESQWLRLITTVARAHGWRWFHVEKARGGRDGQWMTPTTGDPGVPDLWMVRGGQLIIVELKAWRGRARPGQAEWLDVLDSVPGVSAWMFKPVDWPKIQAMLMAPT